MFVFTPKTVGSQDKHNRKSIRLWIALYVRAHQPDNRDDLFELQAGHLGRDPSERGDAPHWLSSTLVPFSFCKVCALALYIPYIL